MIWDVRAQKTRENSLNKRRILTRCCSDFATFVVRSSTICVHCCCTLTSAAIAQHEGIFSILIRSSDGKFVFWNFCQSRNLFIGNRCSRFFRFLLCNSLLLMMLQAYSMCIVLIYVIGLYWYYVKSGWRRFCVWYFWISSRDIQILHINSLETIWWHYILLFWYEEFMM